VALYILVCSTRRFVQGRPLIDHVADISPQNVLTEIKDEVNFKYIEDQESQDPSVPIMSDGATVYKSRATMLELSGIPVLTDFGQMRLAEPTNKDWWMSDLYRAPEVLLNLSWGYPVDVWSVGVMVGGNGRGFRG
jgi:serine/threonine-protein kinase SRPK3